MEVRRSQYSGRLKWDVPMKIDLLSKGNDKSGSPDCVLELACFVKPPIMSFENVKIGCAKIQNLRILNPGVETERIELEKFPLKETGFAVNGLGEGETLRFSLEPQQELVVPITWQPKVAGNSRHLVVFKWIGGQKLQVVILASAIDPDAGKKKKVKRHPAGKTLQPSSRTNIFQQNTGYDKLTKDKPPKPATPEHGNTKNLVDILPDTPSRRQTFTVVQSILQNKMVPKCDNYNDEKENIAMNEDVFGSNKATFRIEREGIAKVEGTVRKNPFTEVNEVEITKKGDEFTSQRDNLTDTTIFDTNTFHESEIRLSSSPIKHFGRGESMAMLKPSSDLNPGQVVMNGEVKHQFIPYPSFNNTDTFLHMEMAMDSKPKQGYDDSLSFGSAASSLFTLTREERFSPNLETVCENSDVGAGTSKSDMTTTLTNENCAETFVDNNGSQYVPSFEEGVSADETSDTLRASDANAMPPKEISLISDQLDPVEAVSFDQGSVTTLVNSSRSVICDIERQPVFLPQNSTLLKDNSVEKGDIERAANEKNEEQNIVENKDVDQLCDETSRFMANPIVASQELSTIPTSKDTGKSRPNKKTSIGRKSLPSAVLNSNFDAKELAKKNSRKSNSRFVESRYLSSQNKQKIDKNDNKKEAKQEIKTGSNVVDAKFKSLAAPKKRKSDEDSSKDMARPSLAMKKLKLIKPKSKMPRHPMPYAARNMFYDERWIEKQERGFKNWLNFVLTPPEDDVGNEEDSRKGNLLLESDSSQPVAPTKEVLSFRMYAARRRMARLRRAACIHYQSDQLASVICKLEREIEHGRLALRSDRQVDADLGVRKHIADMLLSFNPLWLRIGLEVVYGEIIPMHSNNDVNSLSRFIQRRLLGNPDIAAEYSHPSVPGLFRQGYVETLAKFTLKKLLLVIIFVDSAKNSRLLSHDPCLFRIESEFKATRDMLLCFSRHYLHREGDLVKHLTYLGYTVSHIQTPLHEYDFGVTNLAVDLRDGLRLVRVVELLTKNWKLSSRLRVPAVSRLQKVHNVGIALLGLKEHEFVQNGLNIDPKYIVDGHREKTLLLLWQIIFHFQVDLLLDEDKLKDEIKHLEKSKQLKLESEDMQHHECTSSNKRESLDSGVYFKSHKLSLLLKWCRLVCALHGVKVENFTVSFSDGRALCYLLHHYHPALLPTQSIKNETSITCGLSLDADQDVDDQLIYENWTQCFSPSTGVNRKLEKLLKNEKQNFTIFSDKVKEIGGGPVMISASDMSNTIPDEKVVIAFLSFLCSRLLDIREEIRAARCIQIAWRQHHLRKQKQKYKALSAAVIKLQAYARGYILRQQMKKKEVACIRFQACWRGYATRKQIRKDAAEKNVMQQDDAATKIQTAVRGYLQRRRLLHQKQSAIVLQTAIRKYLLKKTVALRNASATKIQQRYREWKLAFSTRKQFLEKKHTAITLQRILRANRQIMEKKSESATTIQSFWRMYKCRQDFCLKKEAAVLIQNSFRSHSARQKFLQIKHAVAILQSRWRALQNGKAVRRECRKKGDSVILIQQVYRECVARRAKKTQKAAVCIQAASRMVLQRNRYNALRKAVVSIQAMLRGKIARKRHALLIKATVMMQKRFRAVKHGKSVRHDFERLRTSCLLLQARYRGSKCRSIYTNLRTITVKIQACYRGKKCRDEYLKLQASTLLLQQRFRAWKLGKAARNELKKKRDACVAIQAWYRGSRQQRRYLCLKTQASKMQAIFRGKKARRSYLGLRYAVVNMQRRYRATVVSDEMRRSYLEQKNACIVIQSWYRCRKTHQEYTELKQAAISIQSNVRRFIAFKRHQELKSSTLLIQRRYRALKIGQATQIHYLVTKAAALTIQSIYRGYCVRKELNRCHQAAVKIQAIARMHSTRQKYIELKSAVICMQTRYRASRLAREVSNNYRALKQSTKVLQAAYRGHLARKELNRCHQAAVKIQAIARMHLTRQKYIKLKSAVICMQTRYRASRLAREVSNNYRALKQSTKVLQAAYRGHLARKELNRCHQAAVKIQAIARMHSTRQKYIKLKSAVICMQTRYRASRLAREVSNNYRALKQSTKVLQAAYRGHLARKELNRCHQAAVKIQAIARMHLTRQKYIELKSVVIRMQTRYRASRLAREVSNNYRALKQSTKVLQAAYRGHLARKELNRCHQAAVKIQAIARMHLTRQKYIELKSVVIRMQTRYRASRLAREVSNNYRVFKQSTIVLQAAYRGHLARKELNRCHQAAVKIQAIARMHSTRQKYTELKSVVICMQTRYRASRLASEVSNNYRAFKHSTIVLQAVYRGHQVRKELANMSGAATKIQAIYRTYVARNRLQRMRKAAILIQSRFRGHQRLVEYQKMKSSAVKIQKIFRGYKKTKQAVYEYQKAKRCATTIQAFYRCYAQRREFVRFREAAVKLQRFWRQHLEKKVQELAAVVLQTRWKAYQQAKVVLAAYVNQKQACILIQSVYRRHAAVQNYALIKASILVIQRRFVAYKAMVVQMRNYLALRKSVILIQATYKMYCVRKAYVAKKSAVITVQRMLRSYLVNKRLQKELDAAVVIQRHWMAYAAMLKCRTEYQRKRQAVVVLQSSFRRLSTRRRFIRMMKAAVAMQSWYRMIVARRKFIKKQNAAISIQRHFRAYVLGTVAAANYHVMRGALITLQAGVRGFCARKQYNLQRRLIINLQASIKMLVYRNRYQELRAVTILMQRRVRSNVMAAMARKDFLLKKRACVKIQRGYRRHQDVKMAAISIQSVFRMQRERRVFALKKAACVKIQAVFRRYQQRKVAATVIQSLWRMHRARKEFITKKHACIKVQAAVRRFLAEQQYLLQQGAALVIQRRFRAFLLGSLERLRYLNAKYACVQIQACFRMFTCRRRYLLLRESTITIQQRLRAQIAMKTERDVLARTKSAVVKVQSVYRGYKARQLVASLRQQNMIKEYIKLVERQKMLLRRISAATVIQKNHRAVRDRQRFLNMKNAAITIQTSYKMHKLMIATREDFLQQKRSVVTIQRAYRVYKAKERLQNLKEERDLRRDSAIILQRNFKRFISQRDFLIKKQAIKKIQIVYRRYLLARQLRNEFIAKRDSAVKLQCAFRVYKSCQVVKMLREEKCRQTDACVKIQKSFKGFLARKRFLLLRNAVVAIQSVYRSAQLAKKTREEFLCKREASIVIQTTYRGYCARKLLEELRLQRERYQAIVVRMQRQFRALAATRKQRSLFVKTTKAAIVIQRSYRAYREKEALARREAALVIQHGYRAYRERVMAKFITAAVKIQSCFRRFTQEKNYKRMKFAAMIIQTRIREVLRRRKDARQEQAALVVQKWFRSVSLMRIERKRFMQMKKACLVIQSVWRGYKVRSKICNRKVIKARERIESANSEATEEKKLCNRTTSALTYLLHCRSQTTIFEALKNLEVATRLSYHCCERLAEDNALVVIFEIVKNCNRGLPSIELIQIAISVVINLARCPTTYKYIYEEEDSLELFVDLMNKYREKKTPIFARTATLLSLLCRDTAIAKEIVSNKGIMKKLQSFHYLTGRKANMESKRNGTKLKATTSISKDKKDHLYIFDQFASICRLMERLDNVNVAI